MEKDGRKFPNRLRKHRKLAHLTQKEVARILGVRQSRISSWENGEILPSLINLLKISILYKTLCNELYFEVLKKLQREMEQSVLKDRRNTKGKTN